MASEHLIDINKLPENVRNELNQLELELAEGDITEKGFDKKMTKLLASYVNLPQYRLITSKYGPARLLFIFYSLQNTSIYFNLDNEEPTRIDKKEKKEDQKENRDNTSSAQREERRRQRRLTKNDSRYHSGKLVVNFKIHLRFVVLVFLFGFYEILFYFSKKISNFKFQITLEAGVNLLIFYV